MDEKSEKEAELFKKRQKHRKIPLKYHKKCRKILEKKKNFLPRGDSNPRPLARDAASIEGLIEFCLYFSLFAGFFTFFDKKK